MSGVVVFNDCLMNERNSLVEPGIIPLSIKLNKLIVHTIPKIILVFL
jgi:hypothetical protein